MQKVFFFIALIAVLAVTAAAVDLQASEKILDAKQAVNIGDPVLGWQKHYDLWLYVSVVIFLVVFVPMIYFVFKYRRKSENETGAYIEGNLGLEVLWIVIPIIVVILLGVQSWALFNDYRDVPPGAHEVKVEAYQYAFDFTTPEGIKTTNELIVPEGAVKLLMTSRDVVHNLAIPQFKVREDTVPGRLTYQWFNANKIGKSKLYCAELCGANHSLMLADLTVMKKDEYAQWVKDHNAEMAAMTPEKKGEKLVESKGCLNCHSIDGAEFAGPTFKGIMGRETTFSDGSAIKIDEAYLASKIQNPKEKIVKGFSEMMPAYKFTEEELASIAAYLKTLK
ncbi:cytochrome c oxidase subunit II [Candidatus Magnetoovum chiemensis]|nr:cytochrome c oxidase subunit II [Candidatus Magnetoovum chiemensis]